MILNTRANPSLKIARSQVTKVTTLPGNSRYPERQSKDLSH